ncbi:MAG: metallophosphoesterase [Carboxylicivirga sp.]|jgi:predicted MPP superfamily phosphohydrolase|nr:metallophosphoesterase [Carboxylicivirga sp.]
MKRRSFLYTAGLSGIGLSLGKTLTGCTNVKEKKLRETSTLNGNSFSIYTNAEVKATKVFHITDTHLFLDDERGEKYSEFSKRMAGAYRSNKHFKTGETIPSNKGFEEALKEAKKQNADFIAITGDLFSFPSEAAVEWVLDLLEETAIPFAFVAGNHDWHFEGMKGSSNFLRETWTQKLLKPMYQGNNPLCATYNINGIRFVCI